MAPPAIAAGRIAVGSPAGRRALKWGAAGAASLLLLPIMLVVAVVGVISQYQNANGTTQIGPGAPIPAGLVPVFNQAGQTLDVNPYLLASVAQQESSFGAPDSRTPNYAGCVGFMQTCIGGQGGDSWDSTVSLTSHPRLTLPERFAYRLAPRPAGYPLHSSTHPDYNDPFDAVMAAAVELRGKVGGRPIPNLDQTAYQALCGYYGACTDSAAVYAPTVLNRAKQWQAQSALSPATDAFGPGPGTPSGGHLGMPLTSMIPTSPFCENRGASQPCHPGVDLAATIGTPIYASAAGRVSLQWPAPGGGYGNYTCIDHGSGISTCYAHQSKFLVHLDQPVTAGQEIGLTGCTGTCFGPHLHYEVRINQRPTCPAAYLGVGTGPLGGGAAVCAPGWQQRIAFTNVIPGS